MNANELKEYIINNNKISLILEEVGCHKIKEYNTEYRSALPDGSDPTTVCVKKDNLYTCIRSSKLNASGDIFLLLMKIKNLSFGQAVKTMHKYLGLKYQYHKTSKSDKETEDILNVFKKVKKARCIVNVDMPIYDESILKEYSDLPYISWVREGIMPFVCKKFKIGYSFDKKRIVIPWRHWCGEDENKYVGIVGRTTIKDCDFFNIPKYLCIKPFSKGNNIYGLYENYQSIQSKGYVVVFEAEKSVLKRCSRKDNTGTAVGCHSLTDEQVKILIGLNVDIVIAFDEGVPQQDIRKECEKFYKIRNVYYIYDKWGILDERESPADKPNKQYEFMFKYKIPYDENEHNLFLKKGADDRQ